MVREHFRVLREALLAWAEDRTQPQGMPAWRAFQDGAVAALIEARQRFPDGNVLVVSSGGPIAAMVAAVLKAPPATAVELNLRIRNSSLTEFAATPRRHHLVSFNGLPHLDTNRGSDADDLYLEVLVEVGRQLRVSRGAETFSRSAPRWFAPATAAANRRARKNATSLVSSLARAVPPLISQMKNIL